jgi:hypothetical protein
MKTLFARVRQLSQPAETGILAAMCPPEMELQNNQA